MRVTNLGLSVHEHNCFRINPNHCSKSCKKEIPPHLNLYSSVSCVGTQSSILPMACKNLWNLAPLYLPIISWWQPCCDVTYICVQYLGCSGCSKKYFIPLSPSLCFYSAHNVVNTVDLCLSVPYFCVFLVHTHPLYTGCDE